MLRLFIYAWVLPITAVLQSCPIPFGVQMGCCNRGQYAYFGLLEDAARSIPTSRLILRSRETSTDVALLVCTQAPQVDIQRPNHLSDQHPARLVIWKAVSTSDVTVDTAFNLIQVASFLAKPSLTSLWDCTSVDIVVTV